MTVPTSAWSKNQPSGSSSIRDGDDMIRSDKSVLEAALNDEHYFTPQTSASSVSGGLHRQGSARAFMVARASVTTPSSADSAGKLIVCTDTGALLIANSSSVSTLAGGSQPAGAVVTGTLTAVASNIGGSSVLTFPTSQYDVGGFFAASGGTFTIPAGLGGQYIVTATVIIPSVTTASTRNLAIRRDGALIAAQSSMGTNVNAISEYLTVTAIDSASSGSKYDVVFFHNAGVTLTAQSGRFAIQKVV